MKALKMAFFAATAALLSVSAHASTYQGFVSTVVPDATSNLVHVLIERGAFGAPSACPRAGPSMIYSIDVSTAIGKAMFDTALAAKTSGRQVFISGNDVCAVRAPLPPNGSTEIMIFVDLKG